MTTQPTKVGNTESFVTSWPKTWPDSRPAAPCPANRLARPVLRDLDTIDSELRLLAAVRRSIREHGDEPSSRQVDELPTNA